MTSRQWCTFALAIGVSFILMSLSEAAPMQSHINNNGYYNDLLEEQQQLQQQQQQLQPEEALLELIARFGQQILRARDDIENSKRTVDFGLARGFSGLQEAKHRMGLAAANFAGGPGRKRRSESQA